MSAVSTPPWGGSAAPVLPPQASVQDRMKASAKAIEQKLKGNLAKLNGPYQLIVKNSQSQYRNRAFMGNEEFTLNGAYAGKKGDVILVFKPTKPNNDFTFMEMPVKVAMTSLVGWDSLLEDALQGGFIADAAGAVQQENMQREAELAANPLWGSW